MKSSTLVTANPNFVKKIVFPLELLTVVTVSTAVIHALIAVAIWLVGFYLIVGVPNTTVLFFPIIFLCLLPVLLGVSWILSAMGVVVRDVSQLTGMLNHTLLFLTPIFYSIDVAPASLQRLLLLNPLTFLVEQFRNVLFYGQMPSLIGLALYFIFASIFAWVSLLLFRRLRPIFADLV